LALQTKTKAANKQVVVASVTSTVLWVLSIVLAFVIKAGNSLAFVPDALLLFGFFPLLMLWQRGWLTLIFGVLNSLIGFFLLIVRYLPDEKFTGAAGQMRDHLVQMHNAWTWILIGLLAVIWGAVKTAMTLTLWLMKKRAKKSGTSQ